MKRTILFLCPHSAAKSVLAAAYCQRLATCYGLDWQITFAGTEPDDQIMPAVAELLQAEGLDIPHTPPQRVTPTELTAASYIISLGCDLSDLAPPNLPIETWDDIPPPSQNLLGARDLILAKVERLVDQLKAH